MSIQKLITSFKLVFTMKCWKENTEITKKNVNIYELFKVLKYNIIIRAIFSMSS